MWGVLRFVRLLATVLWVGGLLFFAFVLAPVAFHVLPTVREAGAVVGAALRILDVEGLVSGAVILLALVPFLTGPSRIRSLQAQAALTVVMLAGTAYIHWGILPAMERDRAAAGGDIALVGMEHPARVDFDRLHRTSERVEGGVLLLGLALVATFSLPERKTPC